LRGVPPAAGSAGNVPLTYVYSDQESYDPLARIDGVADLRFPGSTAILTACRSE